MKIFQPRILKIYLLVLCINITLQDQQNNNALLKDQQKQPLQNLSAKNQEVSTPAQHVDVSKQNSNSKEATIQSVTSKPMGSKQPEQIQQTTSQSQSTTNQQKSELNLNTKKQKPKNPYIVQKQSQAKDPILDNQKQEKQSLIKSQSKNVSNSVSQIKNDNLIKTTKHKVEDTTHDSLNKKPQLPLQDNTKNTIIKNQHIKKNEEVDKLKDISQNSNKIQYPIKVHTKLKKAKDLTANEAEKNLNLFHKPKNVFIIKNAQQFFDDLFHGRSVDKDLIKQSKVDSSYIQKISEPLSLNKIHPLTEKTAVYYLINEKEINETKYLNIQFKGQGVLQIDIVDESFKLIQNLAKIRTFSMKFSSIPIPIETYLLKPYIGRSLKIHLTQKLQQGETEILMDKRDYLEMSIDQAERVYTGLSKEIRIKVKVQNYSKIRNKDNRVQFILKSSLEKNNINGTEDFYMLINKKLKFPTVESYDMKASGQLGAGLVKTINYKNEFYCHQECDYYVTIGAQNLDYFILFPTAFPNKSTIRFVGYLNLLEELESDEIVTYEIHFPNRSNGNWIFTLEPMFGNTQFLMNPDKLPEKLENYEYESSKLNGTKQLLISAEYIKKFHFGGNKIFISFKAVEKSQVTSFRFTAKFQPKYQQIEIKDNDIFQGIIMENQILNFQLDLNTGDAQTYNLIFKLKSSYGNSNLILKECSVDKSEHCKVNAKDFKLKSNEFENLNQIFYKTNSVIEQNENYKKDEIDFKFNCQGFDPFLEKNFFNNKSPISPSCRFVVGLIGQKALNKFGTHFTLQLKGAAEIKILNFQKSHNLIVHAKQVQYYKFIIPEAQNKLFLNFQIVALSGDCNLYFSTSVKKPNKNNFDKRLEINNLDKTQLHTRQFQTQLKYEKDQSFLYVYLTVEANTYSILDIYGQLQSEVEAQQKYPVELITLNKNLNRSINSHENYIDSNSSIVYFKIFEFVYNKDIPHAQRYEITLNSNILNMDICIQKNEKFQKQYKCDMTSVSNQLIIKKDLFDKSSKLQILVRKIVKHDEVFNEFPIEFSFQMQAFDFQNFVSFYIFGETYEKMLYGKMQNIIKIDFTRVRKSVILLLSSNQIQMKGFLKAGKDSEEVIQQFDSYNFGIEINNIRDFKQKYCQKNSLNCYLYLIVENQGIIADKFYFNMIKNEQPIRLKEGQQIYIPSHRKFTFITRPKNDKTLGFNFTNNLVESVLYGNIVSYKDIQQPMGELISENNFQYKTKIGHEGMITFKVKEFKDFQKPVILFQIYPKFNQPQVFQSDYFRVLTKEDRTQVSLQSDVRVLQAYNQITVQNEHLQFKYFQFEIQSIVNHFDIFLTQKLGNCQLYLSKGKGELPSKNQYWKKSDQLNDQILNISIKDFKPAVSIIDTYILGVQCNKSSKYELLLTDSNSYVEDIKFQQLVSRKIQPFESLYFNFQASKRDYDFFIYSTNTDIQIEIIPFNDTYDLGLLQQLSNKQNFSRIVKQGEVLKNLHNLKNKLKNNSVILRVEALDEPTQIDLAIYNQKLPLIVPTQKNIQYIMKANESQIFQFQLDGSFEKADLTVQLKSGGLRFTISDDLKFIQKETIQNFTLLDKIGFKYVQYTQEDKISLKNQIFQNIYVKVNSQKASSFIINLFEKNKFIKLTAFKEKIIHLDKQNEQFVYFSIEKDDIQYIHDLVIKINNPLYYNEQHSFFYQSDKQVQLDDSQFLPMPIRDKKTIETDDFRHYEIIPELTSGYFIIKLNPFNRELPVKIGYFYNQKKIVQTNGLQIEPVPLDKPQKFSIYLPSGGEYRLILETCRNLKISDIKFEKKDAQITDSQYQLVQGLPYFQYLEDDKNQHQVRNQEILLPVIRGTTKKEGILNFQVKPLTKIDKETQKQFYMISSEFTENTKGLILKDYIRIYFNKQNQLDIKYQPDTNSTVVSFKRPQIIPQFFQDYPNYKHIKMEIHLYLLEDMEFYENLKKCGLGAIQEIKGYSTHHTLLLKLTQADYQKQSQMKTTFSKQYMGQLSKAKFIIFSHVKVFFLQDENDEYNVTLDQKQTNIPFFVAILQNQLRKQHASSSKWVLSITLLISILLAIVYMLHNKKQAKDGFKKIVKGRQSHVVQKIEMNESKIEEKK